jgi:hypothetical protein
MMNPNAKPSERGSMLGETHLVLLWNLAPVTTRECPLSGHSRLPPENLA